MKTINNLIIVEVPDSALNDRWFVVYNVDRQSFSIEFQTYGDSIYISLDTDVDCYILGTLSEISEEDCKRFVEKVMEKQHYQNYNYKSITDRWVKTAKESFISLLEKNGVDTNENLLIVEKIK